MQEQDHDYFILMAAKNFTISLIIILENQTSVIKIPNLTVIQTFSVQYKFDDSAKLEVTCGSWNHLLSGFHPRQLSFHLWASFVTLPTAVNLRRWNIQCSACCVLCDSPRLTTALVLNGCPVALSPLTGIIWCCSVWHSC